MLLEILNYLGFEHTTLLAALATHLSVLRWFLLRSLTQIMEVFWSSILAPSLPYLHSPWLIQDMLFN